LVFTVFFASAIATSPVMPKTANVLMALLQTAGGRFKEVQMVTDHSKGAISSSGQQEVNR
jgi:hypothetical protein